MFYKVSTVGLAVLVILGAGCVNHPASDSVKAFTIALADSSWSEAWQLLTPDTRAAWDSTAVVFQQFGYAESSEFLTSLSVPVTQEEFATMDGELLFTRMAQTSEDISDLSSSVRGVELSDSTTALVTIATSRGEQIIPVKLVGDRWLLDLTTLTPPPEPEVSDE